jgi:endonuclease/exonuclease/phosphatase family metal-dependent hydrolase
MSRVTLVRSWILGLLVSWCFVGAAPAQDNRTQPPVFRVLSYNIHHGEGVDGKLDLERIARVIVEAKADLVALQEVDQNVQRSGNVDQPAELARLTKLEVAFGGNISLQGGEYGNAILSRWPLKNPRNTKLPNHDQGEQRGVLQVEVQPPGSAGPLLLLATHFDHRRNDAERVASAALINELTGKLLHSPALLAGDLNDVPESQALRELQVRWTVARGPVARETEASAAAKPSPLFTIPVEKPTRQIDFVLVRPAERWKVIDVQVLEEKVASDHRPILATLELLPAK